MKVTDVLATLPELSLTDLKIIQIALDKELIKHLTIDEDLYFLVFEILDEKPMSVSKFTTSPSGALWRKNQPAVDGLVIKLTEGKPARKVLLKAVKKFLLELLIEDIKNQGIPLNMKIICQQLANIETIFSKNFPGYLSCGLGGLIIQQLGGNHVTRS